MNKRLLGNEKEQIAVKYLESFGYKILERNFYIRGAEADIIAIDNKTLCFIEVKFRRNDKHGLAEDAVTLTKQKRIIKLARYYIMTHQELEHLDVRFDVVAINGSELSLIKSAFEAC